MLTNQIFLQNRDFVCFEWAWNFVFGLEGKKLTEDVGDVEELRRTQGEGPENFIMRRVTTCVHNDESHDLCTY
jgi:hypothetical protein